MKKPIEVLVLEKQVIKFFDEFDYKLDSMGNIKTYNKTFISGNKSAMTSQIGIEVLKMMS